MLNWLINLIPADYKWSVAAKNVGYDVAKGVAGILTWGVVTSHLGKMHITLTADQQAEIAKGAGVLATGALAWLHDYLQVKYPNATWL